MWLHHPSGKIAIYVKDPVDMVSEVKQDEQKKRPKKK